MNLSPVPQHTQRAVCTECDLLVAIPDLPEGTRASCPRCGYGITSHYINANERILIFSVSALVCLVFSTLFDFMQMSVSGQQRSISLAETVQVLFNLQEFTLAAFMSVVILGLPVFFIIVLFWLALSVQLGFAGLNAIRLLRIAGFLRFWNMAEIFFLGILVSMIKVAALADISIGISFYSYAFFNVFLIAAMLHLDKFQIGRQVKAIMQARSGAKTVVPAHLSASGVRQEGV